MQIRPFQGDTPGILPLNTEFSVPDWWRPTGCRWNSQKRKGKKDRDGQASHKFTKKFAMTGTVDSYKFGEVARFPLDIESQAGLICSAGALFMVVECDSPEEWDASLLGDAVPTVRSSRGFHYYFAVPSELTDLLPTDGPVAGGDVQTKGFVPAPGTRHPSGVLYELVGDRINVADAALLARLRHARDREKATQLRHYRERGGGAGWNGDGGVNGQDDFLSQVVTWEAVMRGDTEDAVRAVWKAEAAALPLKDKDDPFTEDDFQRHYQGALRKKRMRGEDDGWRSVMEAMVASWSAGGGSDEPPSGNVNSLGDGEPDRFLPAGYIVPHSFSLTSTGVWQTVKHGKQSEDVLITHRPLYVSGIEVDSDGVAWYELTWETHDGSERVLPVPSSAIADRTQLMRSFPEVVVTTKGATAAAEYLSESRTVNAKWLRQNGRTRQVALRLGWYSEREDSEFVSGPGRPYQVRDTANLGGWLRGHLGQGSLEEWAGLLHRMPAKVVMLTAAALSAPLLKILEVPGFVFDNSGGTTQGKTRAARVAASAWGDPDRLLLSWSATKAALELHAQKANGVPLLLDDSKLARDGEQISGLVYQVTSGLMTGRLERSSDRLRGGDEIRTVIVTNGEAPLLTAGKGGKRDGGAVARVLELWGAPFTDAEEADSVNAVIRENHGLAGEEFTRTAVGKGAAELRSQYTELKSYARSLTNTDVARRRADAAAVVMLAARIGREAGLLPAVPEAAWADLLSDDAAEEGSDDMPLAALEALWNEVAFNEDIFWREGGSVYLAGFKPNGGWRGRYEPKDPKGPWLAVKPDWLNEFLTAQGFDAEGIRRSWGDRGWIATDPKGRRTVLVRITGEKAGRTVKVVFKPESFTPDAAQEVSEAGLLLTGR